MAEKVTYKYKLRLIPLLWALFFVPLCAYLGATSIFRQGWSAGGVVLLASLSFVLAVAWILVITMSDIVIDDFEISRRAYGVTWQRMSWSDVRKISYRLTMNPEDGKMVRQFVVMPANYGLFFSNLIIFQERLVGMRDLLDKLSSCADQHNIKIFDRALT